jgi:hypothetical protein
MFRKIAIVLVAASTFAAPALAQTAHSATKAAAAGDSDTLDKTDKVNEKAGKSAENGEAAEKAVTKHQHMARHHHHGGKTARLARKMHTKTAMYHKPPGAKSTKFAKAESHRSAHGKTGRHVYGSAKKSGKLSHHMGHRRAPHVYGRAKHVMSTGKSSIQ